MAPKKIVFLTTQKRAASRLMRVNQLIDFLKPLEEENVEISSTDDEENIDADVLILSKSAVQATKKTGIGHLTGRGYKIFLDPVDDPVSDIQMEGVTGIICAAETQRRWFDENHPHLRSFLLPHHADPRIGDIRAQQDRYGCAYFGDPVNAVFLDELVNTGQVEIVLANVHIDEWRPRLSDYSCHYSVRKIPSDRNVFKPFTKGSTAGKVGAAIVVDAADEEARFWLGEEYPFYAPDDADELSIVDFMDSVGAAFGGKDWWNAVELAKQAYIATSPNNILDAFSRAYRSGLLTD